MNLLSGWPRLESKISFKGHQLPIKKQNDTICIVIDYHGESRAVKEIMDWDVEKMGAVPLISRFSDLKGVSLCRQ